MADRASADEFVPLDPQIRSALNDRGINSRGVQLTASEQDELILMLGVSTFLPRSGVLNFIRDQERERARAAGSGRTLRQIVGSGEEATLSARDERRIRQALNRPRVPAIDPETLTYEEKRRILTASFSHEWHVVTAVRSILSDRN